MHESYAAQQKPVSDLHDSREEKRIKELKAAGAVLERREDRHGDTRKGWWLDGVYLGENSRYALEAMRG